MKHSCANLLRSLVAFLHSLVAFESSNKNIKFRCLAEQILFFSASVYTQWAPNGSREVLLAEFETKFFFISVQNTTGDSLALNKQVE